MKSSNSIAPTLAFALALAAGPGLAAEVALIGTIGDKAAVLSVDGGEPRTVKLGQTWNGVKLISVEKERATVEVDGTRLQLVRGQYYASGAATLSGRQSVTLAADASGHFFAEGAINGVPIRFIVDTGATVIVLPAGEARRLGIDYRKGKPISMNTASAVVPAWLVRLDTVRLGAIELAAVDAAVQESGALPAALLGMSFLSRVEMRRDGDTMTLTRRF